MKKTDNLVVLALVFLPALSIVGVALLFALA